MVNSGADEISSHCMLLKLSATGCAQWIWAPVRSAPLNETGDYNTSFAYRVLVFSARHASKFLVTSAAVMMAA
jgi:hypothetical protein